MDKLQNRVAVITGASTGIGKSIAVAYAGEGAKIVLASRYKDKLATVAREIEGAKGSSLVVPTDVTVENEVIDLFRQAIDAFGRVDILVNNAGLSKGGAAGRIEPGCLAAGDRRQPDRRVFMQPRGP